MDWPLMAVTSATCVLNQTTTGSHDAKTRRWREKCRMNVGLPAARAHAEPNAMSGFAIFRGPSQLDHWVKLQMIEVQVRERERERVCV